MCKTLFRPGSRRLNAFPAALLSACAFAFYSASALANIPQSEREALIAVYSSTGGDGWGKKTGWLDPPGSECSWYGVTCDATRTTVISLDLSANVLTGEIPAVLGNLKNLEKLLLFGNRLSGSIPPALADLEHLDAVSLRINRLSGNIPDALGNLSSLTYLDLYGNQLSGNIPDTLGNLFSLTHLDLSYNQLSGTIPDALGNLSSLTSLSLFHNQLSGGIPPALGNLSSLTYLDLSNNQLSGSIPDNLGNLSGLTHLGLSYNQLSGSIPPVLESLKHLDALGLSSNQLRGNIPDILGSLSSLTYLDLSLNQLSGSIPSVLGNLSSLTYLDLSDNQLSGSIPPALGNLSSLARLYLNRNRLSGSIPDALGNLSGLNYLLLAGNQLSGNIPPALGSLSSLVSLDLSYNELSGSIPSSLGNMPLRNLSLAGNQLSGEIPSTFYAFLYPWSDPEHWWWDPGLNIGYNALQTSDPKLKSLLGRWQAGWYLTQTVAPSQVSAIPFSSSSVLLSWQPIAFTNYGGRYEVWHCTTDGTPNVRLGSTADKKSSSLALNFAEPGRTYNLAVRTVSDPNPSNQNTVTSDFSPLISFKMPETSIDLTLDGAGAATTATFGSAGPTQAGYATASVNTGGTPYATALISYRRNGATVSEAGVPASPPTASARFFVDYRTDTTLPGSDTKVDIYTGFAVVNRGNGPASVSFILRDPEGQIISRGTGSLDKDAHLAAYFNQLPDIVPGFSIDPSFPNSIHFGTLELSSDQPLSVLALRLPTNQRGEMLMTSIPIADLARPSTAGPIYFPQLADGAGYSTTVVLLNTSGTVETGVLHLFANDGSPLVVRQVNGSSASSFAYSIPPGGVYVLQTDASPQDVQTGWAELIPDGGTITPEGAGILQFSQNGVLVTETGVPSVAPTTHARIFLDTSGGRNTGTAIGNPGNAPLNISLQAFQMDGSTQAGAANGPIAVGAKGHAASFVDQLISGLPSGFQGVLDITGDSPFAAITCRSLVNERGEILLTAFPVADLNQPPPFPIVFPQIADGDGFATQFILLNASGPSSATLSFFGETGKPLAVGKW